MKSGSFAAAIASSALAVLAFAPALAFAQDQSFQAAFRLYNDSRFDEARTILEKAANTGKATALDFSLLGSIRLLGSDAQGAERDLRRALRMEPGLVGARLTLGMLLEGEGRSAEAQNAFRQVIAADPKNEEALLALGRAETAEHRWTEAEAHLSRAVSLRQTSDVRPLLALGRLRNLKGNTEGALALCLQAKQAAPTDPSVRYALGVLCLQMDLLKDAAENLEAAVAAERTPANQYALASARIATRNFGAAIDIYRELLRSNPTDAQLNYALGAAYFLANEDGPAEEAFEKSLSAKPDQVESRYYLALLADRQGKHEASIDLLKDVIKRQPDHARAHMALGLGYRSAGDLNEAAAELQTATRLQPDNQKAHYQLGLVLAALKKQEQAKQELAVASRLRQSSDDKVSWELTPASEAPHAQ